MRCSKIPEALSKISKKCLQTKGESYIYVCVLALFMSMLVSVLILYMSLIAQIRMQKQDVKLKLDSCVSEFAVSAFDSLKQGDDYKQKLALDALRERTYNKLGFGKDDMSISYGAGNCTMYRPVIEAVSENGFGVIATYTISVPVIWGGKTYTDLTLDIKVSSIYKFK